MRRRTDATATAPRAIGRLADAALLLCALAGLLSVAWWVVSAFLGLGLVSFATGSMSPKYPTGSVAVSMPVALDHVRIGDVVTVQRGHGLAPITHRVVAITVAPDDRSASVTLKGDANQQTDPAPYAVTALRRVVLPLPPVADALRYTGSPVVVLGVASIIVASIAFAFWPERIRPRHRDLVPVSVKAAAEPVGRHAAS
jgi:signal peptidase